MTPAEKIYWGLPIPVEIKDRSIKFIAAEIQAAVEEAGSQSNQMLSLLSYDLGVADGKADAYEDAAKIVEDHYWDSLEYGGVGKKHGASLATMIRARAAEVQ